MYSSCTLKIRWKTLLLCLAVPLAAGALSGLLIKDDVRLYGMLTLPAFAPPAAVFPIVWTALYLLMGIASYLLFTSECSKRQRANALYLYFLQLGINVVWPFLFFKLGAFEFSFIWSVILSIAVFLTVFFFFRCRKSAGFLMIPYFLWTLFASVLTYSVMKLN